MHRKPPEYGTLREVLFLLIWKKRQIIRAAEVRAMAQSALGGKEAEEAFVDFIQELTQDSDKEETGKESQLRNKLDKMKKIEAIRFRPLHPEAPTRKIKKVKR
jgi:hypothetical protein